MWSSTKLSNIIIIVANNYWMEYKHTDYHYQQMHELYDWPSRTHPVQKMWRIANIEANSATDKALGSSLMKKRKIIYGFWKWIHDFFANWVK